MPEIRPYRRQAEKLMPWERAMYNQRMPGQSALSRWRAIADKRARALGAKYACNLCKRPMMEVGGKQRPGIKVGHFRLHRPGTRHGEIRRRICTDCYQTIAAVLVQLETSGARSNLPPVVIRSYLSAKRKHQRAVLQTRARRKEDHALSVSLLAPGGGAE